MGRKKVIREIPLSSGGETSGEDVSAPSKEPKLNANGAATSAPTPAVAAPPPPEPAPPSDAAVAQASVASATAPPVVDKVKAAPAAAKEPAPPPIVKQKAPPKRMRQVTDKRLESLRAANEARTRIRIERELELKRLEKEQHDREMEMRVQKLFEKHWNDYTVQQQKALQTQRSQQIEDYDAEDEMPTRPRTFTLLNRKFSAPNQAQQPTPTNNGLFSQIFGR
jgi:hypothetical protein